MIPECFWGYLASARVVATHTLLPLLSNISGLPVYSASYHSSQFRDNLHHILWKQRVFRSLHVKTKWESNVLYCSTQSCISLYLYLYLSILKHTKQPKRAVICSKYTCKRSLTQPFFLNNLKYWLCPSHAADGTSRPVFPGAGHLRHQDQKQTLITWFIRCVSFQNTHMIHEHK